MCWHWYACLSFLDSYPSGKVIIFPVTIFRFKSNRVLFSMTPSYFVSELFVPVQWAQSATFSAQAWMINTKFLITVRNERWHHAVCQMFGARTRYVTHVVTRSRSFPRLINHPWSLMGFAWAGNITDRFSFICHQGFPGSSGHCHRQRDCPIAQHTAEDHWRWGQGHCRCQTWGTDLSQGWDWRRQWALKTFHKIFTTHLKFGMKTFMDFINMMIMAC